VEVKAEMQAGSLLFVISGPSGVGKDAVIDGLRKTSTSLFFAVTATTRPQRHGETDGVDYGFVSRAKFERMIGEGELLEWANVYGNYYGVPKRDLQRALRDGKDAVVKVDVQGAATIRSLVPDAILIFVAAGSMGELERRLKRRKTESGIDLELRTAAAREEMKSLPLFDYIVVNRDEQVESAVAQIQAIMTAEKCRVKARSVEL
jgi:guanylate kinase